MTILSAIERKLSGFDLLRTIRVLISALTPAHRGGWIKSSQLASLALWLAPKKVLV